ncbi:hypothetical protein M9H77_07267 [Catharanthus roseus]|uniref:Uncharacterized protein n=1 Tax=Catharanthus roseus TaxID=4058 RepID=A0ACC0BUP7_CATRO|nr:hypothetical protein M9H77_07267 [Catharanthus roseus]
MYFNKEGAREGIAGNVPLVGIPSLRSKLKRTGENLSFEENKEEKGEISIIRNQQRRISQTNPKGTPSWVSLVASQTSGPHAGTYTSASRKNISSTTLSKASHSLYGDSMTICKTNNGKFVLLPFKGAWSAR